MTNRWSVIAAQLPGRTDNDVKNHWNTKLKKKLSGMGIDPVTHKPFSHLITEIATLPPPPQAPSLAEAALGCFKDEMLHLLTKHRINIQHNHLQPPPPPPAIAAASAAASATHLKNEVEKIRFGFSRAINNHNGGGGTVFPGLDMGFEYVIEGMGSDGDVSPWSRSMCTGSTSMVPVGPTMMTKVEYEENGKGSDGSDDNDMFNSECSMWDLASDDLINPSV